MNTLRTEKYFNLDAEGNLELEEIEFEAAHRNVARHIEINEPGIGTGIPRLMAEPLRTWKVGQFEGHYMHIATLACEWAGKRTVPLQESEIDELRAYLNEHLQDEFIPPADIAEYL